LGHSRPVRGLLYIIEKKKEHQALEFITLMGAGGCYFKRKSVVLNLSFPFRAFFINYGFKKRLAPFWVLHKDFNILSYTLEQTCFLSNYINVANPSDHKMLTIILRIQKSSS
jgi:hypothetical protein